MKVKIGKLGFIFLTIVITLSCIGGAFAGLLGQVSTDGTVSTEKICVKFAPDILEILDHYAPADHGGYYPTAYPDYTCNPGFLPRSDGAHYWQTDKNAGWGEATISKPKELQVNLYNVYPSYYNQVTFEPVNCGELSWVIDKFIVEWQQNGRKETAIIDEPGKAIRLDFSGDGEPEMEIIIRDDAFGKEVASGQGAGEVSLGIHILPAALQGITLGFKLEMEVKQESQVTPPPIFVTTPRPTPIPESEPEPEQDPVIFPESEVAYFTVDFEGRISGIPLTAQGMLAGLLEAFSPDGEHSIIIPQGTLVRDREGKTVKQILIRETGMPPVPEDKTAIAGAYDFQPAGIAFSKPVLITLGYDMHKLPERITSVDLAYHAGETTWVILPAESGVVAEAGKAAGAVDHFTIFTVLAEKAPALFRADNLAIEPSYERSGGIFAYVLRIGSEVQVGVDITNIGGQQGEYAGALLLNGVAVAEDRIALRPDQTGNINFKLTGIQPGTYTVEIGGLRGSFVSDIWINWSLAGGTILALAVLGWALKLYGYKFWLRIRSR